MTEFRAPPGTHDVLPPESRRWEELVARFASRARRAGYGLVLGPLFEDRGVFERVGEATDVVRKEMYQFEDRGGRRLALRPEGTAPIVRAFVQHRPPVPFKAWYVSPQFRQERQQAGRYRQHHQVGVEALGPADPGLDVEVVALAWSFCRDLGLEGIDLLVNSLGDDACRPGYLAALREFMRDRLDELCEEHRPRAMENPLRVLDCKRPECRNATAGAPVATDHLCDACAAHFERLREGLAALAIPTRIESRLVRGLDYYTRTTFELQAPALEAAQNAVGGGGRYDKLVEAMGGPPTPGIGFGMGIERLLLACDAEGALAGGQAVVDVWVVDTLDGRAAEALTHQLREAGVASDRSFDGRSMKAQFRAADRSGARLAVVVGEREAAAGTVAVRDLQRGDQHEVGRDKVVEFVRERLA